MKRILKPAFEINAPILFVALPTTFPFILGIVFGELMKVPYDKRIFEQFMTFTLPILLTFALSFSILTTVFYLAAKKIAVVKYLKYIAGIPLALATVYAINEIIIPIFSEGISTDGFALLVWIFNIALVAGLIGYTVFYLVYSLKKVSELYNYCITSESKENN